MFSEIKCTGDKVIKPEVSLRVSCHNLSLDRERRCARILTNTERLKIEVDFDATSFLLLNPVISRVL